VDKIIDQLSPKTSFGFDGLSTKLIKNVKPVLVKPITIIINQMLNNGIFPDKLKIAKIVPTYKKEDETLFTNYRPISLLPTISKIFEKVIFNQLYDFFMEKKLFYSAQYGFRSGHSTEFAALELVDKLIDEMDKNEYPY
jgi:retron-type reverse transcriptase